MQKTPHLILIAVVLMSAVQLRAQQSATNLDTAIQIIERHYEMMNYEAMPQDSMLYIESQIIFKDSLTDTLIMRRWYVWPNRFRLEITQRDSLLAGLRNDGEDEYYKYDIRREDWDVVNITYYHDEMAAYDYRGPLYKWEVNGGELHYEGEFEYEGQPVNSIYVSMPGTYDRHYIFEKESGLLFLINETGTSFERAEYAIKNHIDWRAYMEYGQVGLSLIPTIEQYKQNGTIVTTYHHGEILPIDDRLFTHNYRLNP